MQNLLSIKISSGVIKGFRVSNALKVVFTYIGAHPEFLTFYTTLGHCDIKQTILKR